MSERIILVQSEPSGPRQLIECPVTDGVGRVAFPDIDNLKSDTEQNVLIKGLRLIPSAVLVGPMVLAGVNAPDTELQKMALVLYSDGWEKAEYIPLFTMNDMICPGQTTPYRYDSTRFADWRKVSWTKSYLQFANGTASVGTYVVMFDCEYLKLNAQNQPINGVQ